MWQILSKSPKAKKVLFQLDGLTELEIADLFNEHFINVGAPTKDIAEVPCEQFITKCCSNTMFLSPTDQSKILEIILSLKDSCAAGADGIKPKPLKAVAKGLSIPLVYIICNLILSQGVFPRK